MFEIKNNGMFLQREIKTTIKLYNTPTLPVLLYGSETWTINVRGARRISAAALKQMSRTAG
jgi:penicillin-binding protein-related factor A (putative recombinase)